MPEKQILQLSGSNLDPFHFYHFFNAIGYADEPGAGDGADVAGSEEVIRSEGGFGGEGIFVIAWHYLRAVGKDLLGGLVLGELFVSRREGKMYFSFVVETAFLSRAVNDFDSRVCDKSSSCPGVFESVFV